MAGQGGQVQLEKSNQRLAVKKAKMAKGGFSCTVIEETQFLIKQAHASVQ
jgi:hypothetical protein